MSKALLALLAAGVTAPIVATDGEILNKISLPESLRLESFASSPFAGSQASTNWQEMLANPDQLVAALQRFLASSGEQFAAFAGDVSGMWGKEEQGFYSNPVFFGNYSSGDLRSLYAQAYPNYERAHVAYKPTSQSSEGFSFGQFQGLQGLQGNGGLGGNSFGGLGNMMGTYPGYTSQAEFNDIVFD